MKRSARILRSVATFLLLSCLMGCGALPVGIAPDDGSAEDCRPSLFEPYYDSSGRVNRKRNSALYDEERIKRCEQLYNEAERHRIEELFQDLEKHMNSDRTDSKDGETDSSIVINRESGEFD